jgi:hypothetical protein
VTAILQHNRYLPADSEPWLILILALVAATVLGHLSGASRLGNAGGGLLFLGFLLGPIFPTLVGLLFSHFEQNRGTAFGAMFALGATSNLFLPPLIGAYARRTNVQRSLRIPMVLALILAGVSLAAALMPWAE